MRQGGESIRKMGMLTVVGLIEPFNVNTTRALRWGISEDAGCADRRLVKITVYCEHTPCMFVVED